MRLYLQFLVAGLLSACSAVPKSAAIPVREVTLGAALSRTVVSSREPIEVTLTSPSPGDLAELEKHPDRRVWFEVVGRDGKPVERLFVEVLPAEGGARRSFREPLHFRVTLSNLGPRAVLKKNADFYSGSFVNRGSLYRLVCRAHCYDKSWRLVLKGAATPVEIRVR